MIDPEFWLDEGLAELSAYARLLYIGLWGICDDNYATFPNRPKWIKAQVFPYDSVSIQELLDELSASTHIIKFKENEEEFYYIKNFFKYQKVDRPSAPKYAQFNEKTKILDEDSTRTRPEVKLSKVKLSKVNIATSDVAEIENPSINFLIGLFKEVNPNYEILYKNKTQRKAIENMLIKFGPEKLERTIKALKELINRPYAPVITTPIQLEQKMGDLIVFANKEKNQTVGRVAIQE